MISTNRVFELAHGHEILNFLLIVAGPYSIGLGYTAIYVKHGEKMFANKEFPIMENSVWTDNLHMAMIFSKCLEKQCFYAMLKKHQSFLIIFSGNAFNFVF
jgi:hypothetical protein